MSTSPTKYEGIGDTLEDALKVAHGKIPLRQGKDFTISRVVDWGMQYGGFIPVRKFYVIVEEDELSSFKT